MVGPRALSSSALAFLFLAAAPARAEDATPAAADGGPPTKAVPAEGAGGARTNHHWDGTKLIVATKEAPPFAIKNADGTWSGLSIELWRRAAEDLGLDYELRETDIRGMVQGLTDGTFDAGVAALTVTAEREAAFDFSHPFYSTGLGIAVRNEGAGWLGAAEALFSWQFGRAIGTLLLVLLLVGTVVWLFERRRNAAQFGGTALKGLGAGLWWSAVTMTTVGYGDKAPVTLGGRLIGLVWMFVSVVTISGFTAAIASSLTVSRLDGAVDGPDDLPRVRVGSVPSTTSARYLEAQHVTFRPYPTVPECLAGLAANEVDAVVYDQPILRYHTKARFEDRLRVLPVTFERQDYAIGLRQDSPIREDLNRAILQHLGELFWQDLLFRYLGRD